MEVFRATPQPDSNGFKPVVVVLKSEQEARFIWLLLNFARVTLGSSGARGYETESNMQAHEDNQHEMWLAYEEAFHMRST